MPSSLILVTIVLLVCLAGWWIIVSSKRKAAARAAAEEVKRRLREAANLFIAERLERMKAGIDRVEQLLDLNRGYFADYDLQTWHSAYDALAKELKSFKFEDGWLPEINVHLLGKFLSYVHELDKKRTSFNEAFVRKELASYQDFFSEIEGRSLDQQQRIAIVTDEDNNLIIAGAGSGKTTTIVGKVAYVMQRYGVRPEEILLISFTNKSAFTLASRIGNAVEAKTFHKFGKDIVANVQGSQPAVYESAQMKPFINKTFKALTSEAGYLSKVMEFFIEYMKEPKTPFDFEEQGEYMQFLKDENFRTYKKLPFGDAARVTYRQEIVKSVEECRIANFLLFNRVEYQYEQQYEFETATLDKSPYKPDFSLYSNGKRIYLEHFAVAKNGAVPAFFARQGLSPEQAKHIYWEKIKWARDLHQRNQTTLLETYSYELSGKQFESLLKQKLEQAGIQFHPMTDEERWNLINDAAEEEVKSIITLFLTFIILMKSNNVSIAAVRDRIARMEPGFERNRNSLFLDLTEPLFNRYQEHLKQLKELDFSDMSNMAAKMIRSGQYHQRFKYIIVDEFQDISIGRYQLLAAVKDANPGCKLFCVGDDWQSIYRFAGSDIALFREFKKYFGTTASSKIETTYRFNEPLISMSGGFVMKNPNQSPKKLVQAKDGITSFDFRYSASDSHKDGAAMCAILEELLSNGMAGKHIMVLGRYGFDINRLAGHPSLQLIVRSRESYSGTVLREYAFQPDRWSLLKDQEQIIIKYQRPSDGATIEAEFMTVHKAKGLEADAVIVINCNSGKHGFPSGMSDDRVLNLLLSEADRFVNGEERRLFYVAMTRAKERLYLLADVSYKSKFIQELETESGPEEVEKCPRCKTADIVCKKEGLASNGNKYRFYGCTNFMYGCNFSRTDFENSYTPL